ncbi:unnamed protein product [Toxocara canis]|uniref:Uncharacterized protein n=1 Tax=Toxocara canis TaxID=6265 RepID=A0A183URK7_TOXCA|nr:unnamed protein product [Toxocara canis]
MALSGRSRLNFYSSYARSASYGFRGPIWARRLLWYEVRNAGERTRLVRRRTTQEPVATLGEGAGAEDGDIEVLEVRPPAESGTKENPIIIGIDSNPAHVMQPASGIARSLDEANPSAEKLSVLNASLVESLHCAICTEIIYRCVTLVLIEYVIKYTTYF